MFQLLRTRGYHHRKAHRVLIVENNGFVEYSGRILESTRRGCIMCIYSGRNVGHYGNGVRDAEESQSELRVWSGYVLRSSTLTTIVLEPYGIED